MVIMKEQLNLSKLTETCLLLWKNSSTDASILKKSVISSRNTRGWSKIQVLSNACIVQNSFPATSSSNISPTASTSTLHIPRTAPPPMALPISIATTTLKVQAISPHKTIRCSRACICNRQLWIKACSNSLKISSSSNNSNNNNSNSINNSNRLITKM